MSKKNRFSAEEKIKYIHEYIDGNNSIRSISSSIGISAESFRQWVRNYTSIGIEAFTMTKKKKYSKDLKLQAVKDYLSGIGSQDDICAKYKIRSKAKLQKWISMYNNHNKINSSGTRGGNIMIKGRSTTYNERIDIVKYCIDHENNYAETAQKFQISYQQIYSWIKKYEKYGIEGLLDKRGRRKNENEMSEIEILKAKNKLLESENRRKQMEIDFLKKLEEIERRRF